MTDEEVAATTALEKKAEFWVAILKYVGWPGLILLVLGYAGYRTGVWATPLAESVVKSHIETLAIVAKTQVSISDNQKVMSDNQTRSTQILDEIKETQKVYASDLQKHLENAKEYIVPARKAQP